MKISKDPQKRSKETPMTPQKIKDTLLLLSDYSADGGISTVYANAGFKGYERHELKVVNSYPFLLWTPGASSKIDTPELTHSIDWGKIFNPKPYINYVSDSDGYTFIQAPAIVKRDAERFRTNRQQRYNDFINSISPGSIEGLRLLSDVHGLHAMLEQQIARQIEKLESIDQDFIRLIKVYYYESAKCNLGDELPSFEQQDQHKNLIHDTRHFYEHGIRHVANTDMLIEKWIPKRVNQPFVPAPIGQSLTNGIKALMPIKEQLLNSIIPIVEKLIHIESLKYYALNDMPILTDDERDMPELIDEKIESAKNDPQKRMFERQKANYMYLPQIHSLLDKDPTLSKKQIHIKLKTIDGTSKPSESTIGRRKTEYLEGK